jgi:hypothetical protein
LLTQAIQDVVTAKQQTIEQLWQESEEEPVQTTFDAPLPLCLRIAKHEWDQVDVPTHIDFDLGKDYPLPEKLQDYANKVLRTLPFDLKPLQQLYHDLLGQLKGLQSSENRKGQYQLNIICSLIQWSLQEKIYCNLIGDHGSSILAQKLTKSTIWLRNYGLEPEDFTRKRENSLFDNLAAQLPIGLTTADQLRQAAIEELDKSLHEGPRVTAENWEKNFDQMTLPQSWGPIVLKALATKLASPIVVLSLNGNPKIYNKLGSNTPLFLHDLGTNHFEACIPFKGLQPSDIYEVVKGESHD